jgi:hypothetical protein
MSAGLLESAQNLLAGLLDLGRTRFELFGTELREELAHLATTLLGGLAVLLLAVTNHITQNVASVPFLWVLPLTLYLASFVLCFEGRGWYRRSWWVHREYLAANQDGWLSIQIGRSGVHLILANGRRYHPLPARLPVPPPHKVQPLRHEKGTFARPKGDLLAATIRSIYDWQLGSPARLAARQARLQQLQRDRHLTTTPEPRADVNRFDQVDD